MTIKLYLDYSSQPSRAVWAFLVLNKIQHQLIEIRIAKLEKNRSEEYAKINPMKKVPAIVDTDNGSFALAQSHAIMRYLSRKYPCQDMWYPKNDHQRAAKIDEYLDYHLGGIRKCSYYIFNSTFARQLGIVDPRFDAKLALKDVEFNLRIVDKALGDSSYLVGEFPSIADLSAFFEIEFLTIMDYDFGKWANLSRWMKYMKGIKEVQTVNQKFYKILPKLKAAKPKL